MPDGLADLRVTRRGSVSCRLCTGTGGRTSRRTTVAAGGSNVSARADGSGESPGVSGRHVPDGQVHDDLLAGAECRGCTDAVPLRHLRRAELVAPGDGHDGVAPAGLHSRLACDDFRLEADLQQLCDEVVACIAEGGVVGWFRGRCEFGPRALGNRSILADPRREDAKELLNVKIKRRENFRPFAPSILKEFTREFFEQEDDVPYMEKVFTVQPAKRLQIPAVTHTDGTGRLQTVSKEMNADYYQLIDTFRQQTGIPILLNTSFNENEPIVNSPREALDCFLRTSMDMLVLEDYIIKRPAS